MMPTTPSGTRNCRSSRPFASTPPRRISPTGSGRPAVFTTSAAMASMRAAVNLSRSRYDSVAPPAAAAATSTSLAFSTSSERATTAVAMACKAASLVARDAVARLVAATFARRAVARTSTALSPDVVALTWPPGYRAILVPLKDRPRGCRPVGEVLAKTLERTPAAGGRDHRDGDLAPSALEDFLLDDLDAENVPGR